MRRGLRRWAAAEVAAAVQTVAAPEAAPPTEAAVEAVASAAEAAVSFPHFPPTLGPLTWCQNPAQRP